MSIQWHITVPDSEEVTKVNQGKETKYIAYNIHINGTYHCSARYSVLHSLNDTLKREFGVGCLAAFPGKTMLKVSSQEANERAYLLQVWFR